MNKQEKEVALKAWYDLNTGYVTDNEAKTIIEFASRFLAAIDAEQAKLWAVGEVRSVKPLEGTATIQLRHLTNGYLIPEIGSTIYLSTRVPDLPPVDRDEEMDRTYIPMPGGWEVQTKGKGSSFRICNTKTQERWLIADERIHKVLEQMALDSRTPTPEGV